jgi:hypothetical protein
VDDEADIGLVNTHPKRNSSYHHLHIISNEARLIGCPSFITHPAW